MKKTFTFLLLLVAHIGLISTAQAQTTSTTSSVIREVVAADGSITVSEIEVSELSDLEALLEKIDEKFTSIKIHSEDKTITLDVENDDTKETTFEIRHFDFLKPSCKLASPQQNDSNTSNVSTIIEYKSTHAPLSSTPPVCRSHPANVPLLGVYPAPAKNGVAVKGLPANSGAKRAGIQEGDILTAINGESLTGTSIRNILSQYETNETVEVRFTRAGVAMRTFSTLSGRTPRGYATNNVGNCKVFIGVQTSTSYEGNVEGLRVNRIIYDTPAMEYDVRQGDLIVAFEGVEVSTHHELIHERDKKELGEWFTMQIIRQGQPIEIEAQFKSCDETLTYEPEILEALNETVATPSSEVTPPSITTPPATTSPLTLEVFRAYPNPTYGRVNVVFEAAAVPTTIRFTDITGREVYRETMPDFTGVYKNEILLKDAVPGTIMLSIEQGNKVVSKKLILLPRA